MAFKNFKLETDSDGIVLVTWDTPGRSMNVLDETSVTELEEIVKQTTADAAVKGVVITSGKEALCAGADLSMLEGMSKQYAEMLKARGEEAANQVLFDQSRRFSQVFRNIEISGKPWAAAIKAGPRAKPARRPEAIRSRRSGSCASRRAAVRWRWSRVSHRWASVRKAICPG